MTALNFQTSTFTSHSALWIVTFGIMLDDRRQGRGKGSCLIDIVVQTVDHLGLVAGIVDELSVVGTVNECLGQVRMSRAAPG